MHLRNRELKKRDTSKIKTNPKYRCNDEGSGEEDDDPHKGNEDYQVLSSKEQDFRDTFLKFESKFNSLNINFYRTQTQERKAY